MIAFRKHHEMEFRGLLIELVKLLQPEVYCEIGVKKGYTFNAIAAMDEIDCGIAIDPAGFPQSCYDLAEAKRSIILYALTSDEFAKERLPKIKKKIDFLFIDGDHSKQQLKKDLINFLPFVQDDTGLIFLHDTYPVKPELAVEGYCHDAWKVADEIWGGNCEVPLAVLEIVTIPGPWAGLSILRKRGMNHLHWQED